MVLSLPLHLRTGPLLHRSSARSSNFRRFSGGRSTSCPAASFQWREHVHDARWSQRSTHSMRHAMARAAGDSDPAVSDAADAAAGAPSAPNAGLTDAGPASHALTDTLPGPHNDAVETRAESDFGQEAGMTLEAGDEASAGAFSSSTKAAGVAEQPAAPLQGGASLLDRVPGGAPGRFAAIGLAGFLGLSVVIAVVRGALKMRSPKAKRIRSINKNKAVVETLNRYFPQDRASFGKGEARGLKMKTRFSGTEIFRKYLWYLLRERSFDNDAVADMQQLKSALGLTDDEVQDALEERSQRIYKEYGNVMLDTEGMSKTGVERKATCRALFSKLLYLAESEELLPGADAAARRSLVADVFGATDDDAAQLRIVSLYEVDAGRVEELASEPSSFPEDPDAEE